MITISSKGEFKKTDEFLKKMSKGDIFDSLNRYGQEGVTALSRATPVDSGITAHSWTYEVLKKGGTYSIIWNNTHVVDGRPIAILLQYGHATGNGGYVSGRDYINPALRPIFDRIARDVWREVTSA
jgi:hypothetical protein